MADVVNKTTLQYLKSVNTPDYDTKDWWINPVLPACEQKYWRNFNGKLAEMTQTQKIAKDKELTDLAIEVQKENIISDKILEMNRESAIAQLKIDGVLDSNGDLIV
jgi:hypothetical protein